MSETAASETHGENTHTRTFKHTACASGERTIQVTLKHSEFRVKIPNDRGPDMKMSVEGNGDCYFTAPPCNTCSDRVKNLCGRELTGRPTSRISDALLRHIEDELVSIISGCTCWVTGKSDLEDAKVQQTPDPPPPRIRISKPLPPKVQVVDKPKRPMEPEFRIQPLRQIQFYRMFEDSRIRVEVTLTRDVLEHIRTHSNQSNQTRKEVGGFLIGHVRKVEPREYQITLTDCIPIKSDNSSHAHVEFGEAHWIELDDALEKVYQPRKEECVGWYHTHPDQGIFFSPKDRDVHKCFTRPHDIAIVVDPPTMNAAIFAWTGGDYSEIVESMEFPLRKLGRNRGFDASAESGPGREPDQDSDSDHAVRGHGVIVYSDQRDRKPGWLRLELRKMWLRMFDSPKLEPAQRPHTTGRPGELTGLRFWLSLFFLTPVAFIFMGTILFPDVLDIIRLQFGDVNDVNGVDMLMFSVVCLVMSIIVAFGGSVR